METKMAIEDQDQDDFLAELMAIPVPTNSLPPGDNWVPLEPLTEISGVQETIGSTVSPLQERPLSEPSLEFQVQEIEPGRPPMPLVLERWQGLGKPIPLIACARCTASMWINRSNKTLENYCRAMHLITWSSGEPEDLTDCQGLEMSQ